MLYYYFYLCFIILVRYTQKEEINDEDSGDDVIIEYEEVNNLKTELGLKKVQLPYKNLTIKREEINNAKAELKSSSNNIVEDIEEHLETQPIDALTEKIEKLEVALEIQIKQNIKVNEAAIQKLTDVEWSLEEIRKRSVIQMKHAQLKKNKESLEKSRWCCLTCGKSFQTKTSLSQHMNMKGHSFSN